MATRKKKKQFDITAIVAAAAGGIGQRVVSTLATNNVDFFAKNKWATSALTGIVGTALIALADDDEVKAVGYGMLGTSGGEAYENYKHKIGLKSTDPTVRNLINNKMAQVQNRMAGAGQRAVKVLEDATALPKNNIMKTLSMQEALEGDSN